MRAAFFREAGKPLEIGTTADPTPAPDDVIIAVQRAGICGSDLHITQYGAAPSGTVLGHEFAGEIVALGSAVQGEWKLGDRVTALPIHACGECDACDKDLRALCSSNVFTGTGLARPGAYAEYVGARASTLQRLPAGVSFEQGAMVEPLAVAHHAVSMARIEKGAAVLVIGAGPIGAAATLFARLAGAGHVVVSERSDVRRQRALEVGATAAIDPVAENLGERFRAITGRAPEVVLECVGMPGLIQEGLAVAGVRARIVVVGVCFEEDRFHPLTGLTKEASIHFSQCYHERDFEAVIGLLASGKADARPLHTQTVGFAELPTAFEALRTAMGQCKVLIDPRG
ncbi:2-desacetyl-2-hydroxyethyl bacteriochlorophyllide A dehydrogenase [Sphingomonas laterariae]|uniref:2-desacetyl-2-hydroxyethyl bacteriochlorophyllide A dehydrogenase n=1 Tax=Edaphosphingomonas laterariae TaxID=861865 RepID=A0A239JIW8_9SPHN|nr:alcohol dehydrogenase catalytic domain-containing protein [Sphingomonas laterariae]SNT04684.1 2-desacetyl-2-hydroxyethyl bacteriochlorophyllide A dehydrogenase [Sphingomonas laterariae]